MPRRLMLAVPLPPSELFSVAGVSDKGRKLTQTFHRRVAPDFCSHSPVYFVTGNEDSSCRGRNVRSGHDHSLGLSDGFQRERGRGRGTLRNMPDTISKRMYPLLIRKPLVQCSRDTCSLKIRPPFTEPADAASHFLEAVVLRAKQDITRERDNGGERREVFPWRARRISFFFQKTTRFRLASEGSGAQGNENKGSLFAWSKQSFPFFVSFGLHPRHHGS